MRTLFKNLIQFILLSVALILTTLPAVSQDNPTFQYEVRHDHDPWGACRGTLTISTDGIQFESSKAEHSRSWKWIDIQSFDRFSEERFTVLTWQDERRLLGRDKEYDFSTLPGTEPLADEAFALVRERTERPLTDRVPLEVAAQYEVPVKHLHKTGGCQGVLRFGEDWVVFESENANHSRSWRRGRDIESVWSSGPYHLEIHASAATGWLKANKRFRFQLKQRLDQEYYENLRTEVHIPPSGGG